jgi:hypothetical protein
MFSRRFHPFASPSATLLAWTQGLSPMSWIESRKNCPLRLSLVFGCSARSRHRFTTELSWIPASAGMTESGTAGRYTLGCLATRAVELSLARRWRALACPGVRWLPFPCADSRHSRVTPAQAGVQETLEGDCATCVRGLSDLAAARSGFCARPCRKEGGAV